MPVEQIPFGVPVTVVQNVAYAIPNAAGSIFSTVALESGPTATGPWTAVALGASLPNSFIRCPTGAAVVTIRKS